MQVTAKEYAKQLLDKLKAIDVQTNRAMYEMGQILSAIDHGKLWKELGYTSTKNLIEEELSFSYSTGNRYLNTYRHLKRLRYKKEEAIKLIHDYSYSAIAQIIAKQKQKPGKRTLVKAVKQYRQNSQAISFILCKADRERLYILLEAFGAERKNRNWVHVSEALMAIVNEFELTDVEAA